MPHDTPPAPGHRTRRRVAWLLVAALLGSVGLTSVSAPAFAAPPTGTLSVTVTADGAPYTGGYVYAEGVSVDDWESSFWPTGNVYTVTNLTPGTYLVSISPSFDNPNGIVGEYYNDTYDYGSATLVTIEANQTKDIAVDLARGATISGRILDLSGNPVVGASANANASNGWGSAQTDSAGRFTIVGLKPGSYQVYFVGPDGSALLSEYWNNTSYDTFTPVIATVGQVIQLSQDVVLAPSAVISGTVTDSNGVAVSGARVTGESNNGGWDRTTTDSEGHYQLDGLTTGSYYMQVAKTSQNLVTEWWNDEPNRETADPIDAVEGQALAGRNVQLAQGASISGTVTGPWTTNPGGRVYVFDSVTGRRVTKVNWAYSTGTYSAVGLPAGSYTLSFYPNSNSYPSEWWNDAGQRSNATPITLSSAEEKTGINPVIDLPGNVTGIVTDSSGNPLTGASVEAFDGDGEWVAQTTTSEGGTYNLGGLRAGNYSVRFALSSQNLAAEYYDSATTRSAATPVAVTSGGTHPSVNASLLVGSTLSGKVTGPSGEVPGCVYVSLDNLDVDAASEYAFGLLGADGNYSFQGLGAGDYTLRFSVCEEGLQSEWWNDAEDSSGAIVHVGSQVNLTGYDAQLASSYSTFDASIPTIGGMPVIGNTLTAQIGSWSPAPESFNFQWKRNGADIPGAVTSTYLVAAPDLGETLTVAVTGKREGYATATRTSAATAVVTAPVVQQQAPGELSAAVPTITGTAAVGETVTSVPGAWGPAPVTLTVQWLRGGAPIAGATAATYKLTAADAGKAVSVSVTGTKPGFTSASRTSAAIAVPLVITQAAKPKLAGSVTVGSTVKAKPGTWSKKVKLSYQWYANGKKIKGATKATLKLTKSLIGKKLTVKVTGKRSGYGTVVKTSTATAKVKAR